jgi:hypothetical protein
MTEHFRFDPCLCAVCRCSADGTGYAPKFTKSVDLVAWTCSDQECTAIANRTYQMRQQEFNRVEEMATVEGGNEAGQYLDEIGKTDLATLTELEWQTFCRKLVGGYRVAMKTTLRDEAPF